MKFPCIQSFISLKDSIMKNLLQKSPDVILSIKFRGEQNPEPKLRVARIATRGSLIKFAAYFLNLGCASVRRIKSERAFPAG